MDATKIDYNPNTSGYMSIGFFTNSLENLSLTNKFIIKFCLKIFASLSLSYILFKYATEKFLYLKNLKIMALTNYNNSNNESIHKNIKEKSYFIVDELNQLNDEIKENLECGISNDLMRNPVLTSTGYSFENSQITWWLSEKSVCPFTKKEQTTNDLRDNINLIYAKLFFLYLIKHNNVKRINK